MPLAVRKNLKVSEALTNERWMIGLRRISTEEQLDQFLALWGRIQQVQLSEERDIVTWKWTTNGKYSASSAYAAQFLGRMERPDLAKAWRIRAEGKVKFFFWLMLQNRNWTADRLRARGWPHDDACCLCDQELESANHLVLMCPFVKEVRELFAGTHPRMVQLMRVSHSIEEWWSKAREEVARDDQNKKDVSTAIYTFWHVWKERGRRIFQHEMLPATSVASLIKGDVELLFMTG